MAPFRDAWILFGGLLVLIGFGAGQPIVAAVGFVIFVVSGIGTYWHRHLWDRVTLSPTLDEHRVFVDEPVTMGVVIENRKVLPLPWFEWRMTMADALRVDGEMLTAQAAPGVSWLVRSGALGWYERQRWSFTVRSGVRGYYRVGPTGLRSSDILGLFPSEMDVPDMRHLTVFPRAYALPDLGLPADRPFGEQRGRDRLFEDPLRIAGIREYRSGDPMRRIDWKATARHGALRSRLYEPSATRQLYVLANLDTLEHSWEGYLPEELERLVSVAASVAVWATHERYAVGLLANGSFPEADRPIRLPPSRSKDQLTRILEALAVVQPLTMGDLAGAIRRETGRMPLGSTVVCVASLIPDDLAAALSRLAGEGYEVAILATSERIDADALPGVTVRPVARAFEQLGEVVA